MAERYGVGIIGGGVIGLAVARELGRLGVSDAVIIERDGALGQGSTSRANGGVRAQFTTRSNVEFSSYTIRELEHLDRETAGLPGFIQAGYLLVAGTERSEESLRRGFELQLKCGLAVDWLDPEAVLEHASFIRADGIRAGTYCARDGLIDPHGVVQALHAQVRRLAIETRLDTEVLAIRERGGGFHLETSSGSVDCDWIVNAAGPDASEVASLLGVDLPCHPVRRNLACTDPVDGYPEVIPMCVDLDTGVLIRRESRGFLIAYSNPDDPPGKDTSLDPAFLGQVAERVGNRFPFLQEIAIREKNCWAGLYPETPDHHAIIGPAPGLPRFLQCVGFGGHGIMHSIAAGRAIGEIVAAGRSTTLDIEPLRFSRFEEGDTIVEDAVL